MALVGPDGRWIDANPALCEFLGYTREELLSLGWQDVTPPEDVPAQLDLVAELVNGTRDRFRNRKRYIRKDGRIVHADLSVTPLGDGLGARYNLAQIIDVTDREEALAALAASDARYRLLIEHSTDVAFRSDPSGRFEWLSESVESILGYRPEELVGTPTRDLVHPDDRPVFAAAASAADAGEPVSFQCRYLRKDRQPTWLWVAATPILDADGRVAGRTGIARRVDDLVRSQAALARAESVGHVGHWTWRPPAEGVPSDPTWSPEAYRILGLDPSGPALDLAHMADLLTPDSMARSVAAIEQALADGRPYTVEVEFDRPDGTHGWAEIRGAPDPSAGERPVFTGVLVDISHRKRAEGELESRGRELERRGRELEEAQRVGQTGSFWWDPASDAREWSPEMYRLYGRPPGSRIPTRTEASAQMSPDEAAELNARVADALRSGDPYEMEFDLRGLDGIERRLLARGAVESGRNGAITGVRGTVTDITVLAEARLALEASEHVARHLSGQLAEAQALAHVGSWTWDPRSDTVEWSAELFRIYGADPSEPAPGFAEQWAYYEPGDLARLTQAVEVAVETGDPYELELSVVAHDGVRRHVVARGAAVRDATGGVVGLRGTVADITELHDRREARSRRVADRAEYLARAEHTLRTHLTVVEGWADAIGETADSMDPDTLRRAAAAIGRNAASLTRLMHALMVEAGESARAEGIDAVPVDVASIAARVAEEYCGIAPVRSLTVTPQSGVRALGTEDAVSTVVGHLVENALKFAGGDGSISVEVERPRRGAVELTVTDDGPGLPEGLHVFDPFSHSGPRAGHGLGLHVVRTLVEAMGGTVRTEPRPDGASGARFVVTLRAA